MAPRIILLCALFAFVASCASSGGGVTLQWDAVTLDVNDQPEEIYEYRVVYGTASGVYDQTVSVGNVTSYTVPDSALQPGTTYYFAVKAVDLSGNESDASNEVSQTTPAEGS